MQVIVQNLLTHYQQSGDSGKQILLLHGWADKLETYDLLVSGLGEGYHITRLDLPGFGGTQAPEQSWGLNDYANFVGSFADKLSVKPDIVIGHSNGGAVAIVAVEEGLVRPKHLVLLSSAGIRNRQTLQKLLWKAVAKLGKVLTFWLPKKYKKSLQKKLYGAVGSDMLVAPHLQETFKKTVAEDITLQAEKLDIPTMLIYGDQDKATPVRSVGKPLHEAIAGSVMEIVPDADHFVHQQEPEKVAELIKEFTK
jgi:pimeloyl-ACP methyl ester carboxylesterase